MFLIRNKLIFLIILGFICTVFGLTINVWADEATHFQYHKSFNSVFFWGSVKVNGIDAEVGDELGIFDPNAKVNDGCIGAAVITTKGHYQGIPAYEDDPVTTEKDGAISGDNLTFKLWKASENKYYEMDPNGPDEPVWTTNLDVHNVNLITKPAQPNDDNDNGDGEDDGESGCFVFSIQSSWRRNLCVPKD